MILNIREMLDGRISRLRYVFRYSTSRVQQPESVAEHSYFVCLYCLLIARWYEENYLPGGEEVEVDKLLQRAILHDVEEAVSGDFPRPFKHSNAPLRNLLENASKEAFVQVMEPLIGPQPEVSEDAGRVSEGVTSEYICSWLDAKDGTLEGRILEFADFLSVLGFLLQECDGGSRRAIVRHVGDMNLYFKKFKEDAAYDFIRPLIKQAEGVLQEVFHGGSFQ